MPEGALAACIASVAAAEHMPRNLPEGNYCVVEVVAAAVVASAAAWVDTQHCMRRDGRDPHSLDVRDHHLSSPGVVWFYTRTVPRPSPTTHRNEATSQVVESIHNPLVSRISAISLSTPPLLNSTPLE